jgi:hypothetical protein
MIGGLDRRPRTLQRDGRSSRPGGGRGWCGWSRLRVAGNGRATSVWRLRGVLLLATAVHTRLAGVLLRRGVLLFAGVLLRWRRVLLFAGVLLRWRGVLLLAGVLLGQARVLTGVLLADVLLAVVLRVGRVRRVRLLWMGHRAPPPVGADA